MSTSHLPTRPRTVPETYETITLDELLRRYELVDVDERGHIITTRHGFGPSSRVEKAEALSDGAKRLNIPSLEEHQSIVSGQQAVSAGEISVGGTTLYRRAMMTDYNPLLSGIFALQKYREMKTDAIVRNTLRMPKTPVLSARWFVEPASEEPIDRDVAHFVEQNLRVWLNTSFDEFIIQSLTMLDYGVSVFEKVFDTINWTPPSGGAPEMKIYWRKFAPRAVDSISEFIYDDEGGPGAIIISTESGEAELPIWKGLIFSYDKENGDLWGMPVLRSAYKHWFYKEQLYKIDAVQKERHGIGIPVIVLPPNFTRDDKIKAEQIGESLRTNEKAHVVLPPGWDVHFLKLEGQRVDALESAQHHADKLYENVMANFMLRSTTTGETNVQQEMFVKSARFTAEIIRDTINKYAIPQLVNFNWLPEDLAGYPQLRVRRLGDERDWRVLSFAMRNLVGARILQVDQRLEDWIREEMDMPKIDFATLRQVQTPQAPGLGNANAGPPRQSTTDKIEPMDPPEGQNKAGGWGQDRSGTSERD